MHKRQGIILSLLVASIAVKQGSCSTNAGKSIYVDRNDTVSKDSYLYLESVSKQGSQCFKNAFQTLKESLCDDLNEEDQTRVSHSYLLFFLQVNSYVSFIDGSANGELPIREIRKTILPLLF